MASLSENFSNCAAKGQAGDTIIFLDIDGVLNVGIPDPSDSTPLLLNDQNVERARKVIPFVDKLPPHMQAAVKLMVAVADRELSHDDGTYGDFACQKNEEVSRVFVRRLAHIIRASGPDVEVVLSSNWRLPKYRRYVEKLEGMMSQSLGERFVFRAKTREAADSMGFERLRTIGDYMEGLGLKRNLWRPLNVLVIDDFFVTSFDSGNMDIVDEGMKIRSPLAAADYLCHRYSEFGAPVTCTVIHTYDSWHTDTGLSVQCGCGLTREHVCQAMRAVDRACQRCSADDDASTDLGDSSDEGYARLLSFSASSDTPERDYSHSSINPSDAIPAVPVMRQTVATARSSRGTPAAIVEKRATGADRARTPASNAEGLRFATPGQAPDLYHTDM